MVFRGRQLAQIALLLFWGGFWLLNGLDKFFNAPGFFGVTRDQAFIEYFARIGLPDYLALFVLYSVALFEIALGLSFGLSLLSTGWRQVLILFNFLASMALFIFFSFGDILFGDRAELLEHGTYLILILVSFSLLLSSRERTVAWQDMTIRLRPLTRRRATDRHRPDGVRARVDQGKGRRQNAVKGVVKPRRSDGVTVASAQARRRKG